MPKSLSLHPLGLSEDSPALQSVCPPTPAALIIGSARLSPSNSSPILLLPQSPASTAPVSLSLYLPMPIYFSLPPRSDTLLNAVPIGYY